MQRLCLMTIALLVVFALPTLLSTTCAADKSAKPNIIIILTDDMGYSDLGCYGSEIATPTLDALATKGVRLTQFYNTGRCCPTRASLLTGLYPHQAGMGHMTGDYGEQNPGYRGRLSRECVTIGEVLQPAGYRTITTGKWHVGAKQKEWWPYARGFDRSYAVPRGGGFYWKVKSDRTIVSGEKVIYSPDNNVPEGWYATDAWADEGLKFATEAVKEEKPFFWYLAFNAPHWPLQAKPEDIAKYEETYKVGWDVIRERRLAKMKKLGIVSKDAKLTPRPAGVPAWDSLSKEQQKTQANRMAIYAACIDSVDQNVAKIEKQLKKLGAWDNTLLFFLQDNGGCAEGGNLGNDKKGSGVPGSAESFVMYGECWANVSNTPFREYKHWVHEGGASTPLIIHWKEGVAKDKVGTLNNTPSHLIDLMATCVDVAGAKYPTTFAEHKIKPMEGVSLRPLFQDGEKIATRPLFFEHEGNRAVRLGDWKLVAKKGKPWELYNIAKDRSELNNLAKEMPEKVEDLSKKWDQFAERANVLLKPRGKGGSKKKVGKKPANKKPASKKLTQKDLQVSTTVKPADGVADEVTGINARDFSMAKEQNLPYLKVSIIETAPKDLKDGIAVGKLAEANCDRAAIEELTKKIHGGFRQDIDSMLIYHDGKLVLESYYRRGRPNLPHYQMSIVKSITALGIGRAMQLGYIKDLNKPVVDFLKEIDKTKLVKGADKITVAECLNMRSGIRVSREKSNQAMRNRDALKGQGQAQLILQLSDPILPKDSKGLREYKYNWTDPTLVMQVLEAIVPGTARDFLDKEVLGKLGITEYYWQDDISGLPKAAAGASLRSRDMLKLGMLIAQKGKWNGQQLWSTEFIEKAISPLFRNQVGDNYGYFWWGGEFEYKEKKYHCTSGRGAGGQFIYVINELDLIVVITSHNKGNAMRIPMDIMKEAIIPAFVSGGKKK